MTMATSWILGGIRTPFAKAGSVFRRTPSYELGRMVSEREATVSDEVRKPDRMRPIALPCHSTLKSATFSNL